MGILRMLRGELCLTHGTVRPFATQNGLGSHSSRCSSTSRVARCPVYSGILSATTNIVLYDSKGNDAISGMFRCYLSQPLSKRQDSTLPSPGGKG